MEEINIKALNTFKANALKFNIELDENQIEQFLKYYKMLDETNKKINLTAITEFEDVLNKHFLDSISIAADPCFKDSGSIIDIGTGAGFPGIPLKILFPEKKMILADSLNKRIGFINEVIDELKLKNIKTVHSRAEDLANDTLHREKYDIAVSRAVARLNILCEYSLPFVKKGGYFISYKSGKAGEEIKEAQNALKVLGGEYKESFEYEIESNQNVEYRCLLNIKKIGTTPKKYPRKAGTAIKNPL